MFFGTTLPSFFLSMSTKRLLSLDLGRVLAHGEVWRLVSHHFTFESYGEAVVGALHLYWFRNFERMLGSRRFGAFAVLACSLATSLVTGAALALGDRREEGATYFRFAPGPYALIFSMYSLFYSLIPATRPKLVGILGIDISDKSLVYLCGAQLLFSGGARSFIPGACGVIAGFAYLSDVLKLYNLALPKSLDKWLGGCRGSTAAASEERHNHHRADDDDDDDYDDDDDDDDDVPRPSSQAANDLDDAALAEATARSMAPPEPSEANIETLVAMGFDRDRAVDALRASRDNLEHAANSLLSG